MTGTIFLTYASAGNLPFVRLLIDSLRTFGGELADTPFWIFTLDPGSVRSLETHSTHVFILEVPEAVSSYPFGRKVAACARAEELAPAGTRSLAWIDPACIIVQPPACFALSANCDAAFRPVHIRNVGLTPFEHLDAFWNGIYTALGVKDIHTTVNSFVDDQTLRTYFNSHAFAVNPRLGLMQGWCAHFQLLISNKTFQSTACSDEIHQIFLFQAILSTLIASSIAPDRICLLPPTYNYPYHLQKKIPDSSRAKTLNELVCFTYEDEDIQPSNLIGIEIHDPLRYWLENRI